MSVSGNKSTSKSLRPGKRSPLMEAIKSKNPDAAMKLLSGEIDLEERDIMEYTPLMAAVSRAMTEIAKALVIKGANPNIITGSDESPLSLALKCEDEDFMIWLAEKTDLKNFFPVKCSFLACQFGKVEFVKYLMNKGFNFNQNDRMNFAHIHYAANSSPEIVRLLIEHGADPNARDNGPGVTPLMIASWEKKEFYMPKLFYEDQFKKANCKNNAGVMAELLKAGADPSIQFNQPDSECHGMTALMYSAQAGSLECVKILVEYGADINQKRYPLNLASRHTSSSIEWQNKFACAPDEFGDFVRHETALVHSIEGEHVEVMKYLLQMGASTDLISADGESLLMKAVQTGQPELVRALFPYCPDYNYSNNYGHTPLSYAENNHPEIAQIFKSTP